MTETTPEQLYGLADAQKRSKDTLAYRLGRSLAQLLAAVLLFLAAWKALELVGVL